jgi:hypothetical protein
LDDQEYSEVLADKPQLQVECLSGFSGQWLMPLV